MKKRSLMLCLLMSLFLIGHVSAGIYFSQPLSYYNLGDIIEIDATVDPLLEGFLKVDLICDGGIVNVFYGIPNEDGSVKIKFPLTFSYIQETSGKCYFLGDYFDLSGESNIFEISKALNVHLNIDNLVSKPGELITVSGSAKRINDIGINGEVKITIPLLNLMPLNAETEEAPTEIQETTYRENASSSEESNGASIEEQTETETRPEPVDNIENGVFYGKVNEGQFSVSFRLNENTPAGNYRIDVLAYEKDSLGKKTSEGIDMINLEILQILKNVDIAVSTQNIDPGKTLEIRPLLRDQADNVINSEVSIIIRNEYEERVFEKIVPSEETLSYLVPTSLTSGYYEIEASKKEINSFKKFYVNEKATASFEIKNNTLIVTNIGNIRYDKDIQVELNGKPFVKKIDLGLGESQEFKLTGDGDYNLKVSDGEVEISQGGITLTGNVVGVKEVKKGFVALKTPIIWMFFIIILGAGVLFFFRNVLKKKSFAYPFKERLKARFRFRKKNPDLINPRNKPEKYEKSFTPLIAPNQAEQVLVLKGHKNKVSVLAVKIKNKLTKENKKYLDGLMGSVYKEKGAVYEKGDYIMAVFSPLITRSFRNEVRAAKVAQLIQASLKEYNKKFKDKIMFGIGIGSGDIINKVEDKKLKFTALGNLIPGVKRIAESSNEEVLLTGEAYEKAGSEIKATRHGEIYEVKRVVDQEKNQVFIRNFLDRMDKEEKK